MKFTRAGLFLVLVGGFVVQPVSEIVAQTFVTLRSFSSQTDGSGPQGLSVVNGVLYGAARGGGASGNGTLFKLNADGTGFKPLYSFSARSGPYPYTNADGINPNPPVISGTVMFGTTLQGGSWGYGTIYRVNTDGTGFTNLHSFTAASGFGAPNEDGANPYGRLVVSGTKVYGTTSGGGHAGSGTVFAINSDGTGFTNVCYLPGFGGAGFPLAGLVLSGSRLYGTTSVGGNPSAGTVFAVNTDGTGFGTLHTFAPGEGAYPQTGLLLSVGTLFGTTLDGGSSGIGSVFKINTDGTGFQSLHSFTGSGTPLTNVDGGFPNAQLMLIGNTLYGTASQGGPGGWGTLFAIGVNGTAFTVVHNFTGGSDGLYPNGELILWGNSLYGTASGGTSGDGVLFGISLVPQLTIQQSGPGNVIVSWPTNTAGFTLQSVPDFLTAHVWTAVSPSPVVVNGQNTVTTSISGQRYFRLAQ